MKTNLESLYRELGVIYQFDRNYKYIGTYLNIINYCLS